MFSPKMKPIGINKHEKRQVCEMQCQGTRRQRTPVGPASDPVPAQSSAHHVVGRPWLYFFGWTKDSAESNSEP
jgi:hypothetical protein